MTKPSEIAASTEPAPVGFRYKWYLVGMLWWISFFNYADRLAFATVIPRLKTEFDLNNEQIGWLGSAFAWTYGLAAPFAGRIVDSIRRKTAILGGLYIWSLICMATAVSRKFCHLVFFRAAEGLGECFYYPASVSMISDYHARKTRSRALGLHQTSVYMGTIAGGALAGWIADHYGWERSFLIFGGAGIFLGLALQPFLVEPRRGQSESESQALPAGSVSYSEALNVVLRTPEVLLLLLAFMSANFVAMVLLTWMPTFLKEKFDLSLFMAGTTATVFVQTASMIGAPVGGWLADTLRQRWPGGRMVVQAVGVLSGAPFVFLCGYTASQEWLMLYLTAWGFFKGMYDANIFASVFDVVRPEVRGSMAGFMNMAGWLLGGAPAPVVIGYLATAYGLSVAISSAAVVYILAATLLIGAAMLVRPRRSNETY